jgi:hypothetical protein
MMARFNAHKFDIPIIEKIAHRAVKIAEEAGWQYGERDAQMDVTACHCNGNPLLLKELLEADDFNFAHDVFGIRKNLDRNTGKLLNFFTPRYSIKKGEKV